MNSFMLWLFDFLQRRVPALRWVRPRRPAVPALRLYIPFWVCRRYCEPVGWIKWTECIGHRMWCAKWLRLYLFRDQQASGDDFHPVVLFRWEVKAIAIGHPNYAASLSTADPVYQQHRRKQGAA